MFPKQNTNLPNCRISAASFIGSRTRNEDSYVEDSTSNFYCIADGLGGRPDGDKASFLACQTALNAWRAADSLSSVDLLEVQLSALVKYSHSAIVLENMQRPASEQMATTMTVATIFANTLVFAHVGDCRIYVVDDDATQVTKDHTSAARLIERGVPRPSITEQHYSVLTQCVGLSDPPVPQLGRVQIRRGDKIILATDGFYRSLGRRELGHISSDTTNFKEFVSAINLLLKQAPLTDNATFIAIEVTSYA